MDPYNYHSRRSFDLRNAGVYKDFVASSLVLAPPACNETSQEKNMKIMNVMLKQFLREHKLQLHCKQLSLERIGAESLKSFASGGWSKGQDSVVLMKFLPWLLQHLKLDEDEKPWKYICGACRGMETAMSIFYSEPVFMDQTRATTAADHGYIFLAAYSKLAAYASQHEKHLLYNLVPKLHYLHHVLHEILETCGRPGSPKPYNPLVHSTAQCEDFIGRVARLSRKVKASHVHTRFLRRYRAGLAERLGFLE